MDGAFFQTYGEASNFLCCSQKTLICGVISILVLFAKISKRSFSSVSFSTILFFSNSASSAVIFSSSYPYLFIILILSFSSLSYPYLPYVILIFLVLSLSFLPYLYLIILSLSSLYYPYLPYAHHYLVLILILSLCLFGSVRTLLGYISFDILGYHSIS